MNPRQAVNVNRAKQFARKVDAIRVSTRVKAAEPITDISAPTMLGYDADGLPVIERKPMDALGVTKVLSGKSHGTISTPSSYTRWLRAGRPAHPIYNREAWKAERYVNGMALPTGGKPVKPVSVRHERDCTCIACSEYKRSVAQRKPLEDPRISPRDIVPVVRVVRTQRTITVTAPPLRVGAYHRQGESRDY